MSYVLFAIGFVFLIKGADLLVDGASSIAKRNNIPELVIGLTIVSFGTSMPELLVNLMASFDGSSDLAIGNVFGSNIANILLILGVAALIKPLPIQKSIYFTEIPISLVATFMVGFLANADLLSHITGAVRDTPSTTPTAGLTLSRFDGSILLFFFGMFMAYIYVVSRSRKDEPEVSPEVNPVEEIDIKDLSKAKSVLYIVIGSVALFIGGKWVVDGAVEIAEYFNLSQTFIGLTVIAIGTSLPELVTSAVAAKKGQADMAVGNVIGSNIFNLLWILGLSATIRPLPFNVATNTDILMVIAASTLLILAVIIGRRPRIDRWEGVVFVLTYITYIVFLVIRNSNT